MATYASPQEFIEQYDPGAHGCLVLDVAMSCFNGLELNQMLTAQGSRILVIFITGHGDIPMSVEALKQGQSIF